MTAPQERVTVLAVSPAEEDFVSLDHIFSHSKWHMDRVRTLGEMAEFLKERECAVIICTAELPDGDWKAVLAAANLHPIPPRLIVTSQTADDHLWAEVLDRGGYDVLGKPYDPGEVVRVVSLAWRQWKHESARQPRKSGSEEASQEPASS